MIQVLFDFFHRPKISRSDLFGRRLFGFLFDRIGLSRRQGLVFDVDRPGTMIMTGMGRN